MIKVSVWICQCDVTIAYGPIMIDKGLSTTRAITYEAVKALMQDEFDIIVLDLVLKNGSTFAISDFANYRRPKARVVFVTNTSFFSDGSIFQHCSNACAYLQSETPPDDLVAMVEHYAERA